MNKTRTIRLELLGHDQRPALTAAVAMHLPDCRVTEDGEGLCRSEMSPDGLCVRTKLVFPDGRGAGEARWAGERMAAVLPDATADDRRRRACYLVSASLWKAACALTGERSPWGSLTGVRPAKVASRMFALGLAEPETRAALSEVYGLSETAARICTDAALSERALRRDLRPDEAALYIGIPYCPTVCSYCSFVSRAAGGGALTAYLDALSHELSALARRLSETSWRLRSVYVGGGTPTVLSPDQLRGLLSLLHERFDLSHCRELTVEAGRPDTVTEEKLSVLRNAGVTRLCVNTQSLDDEVLRAIGRRHTAEEYRRALALAREAGGWQINTDLIAGLPGERTEGFLSGLSELVSLGVPQITVHSLAMKNASVMTERGPRFNPDQPAMLRGAAELLYAAGYAPYYLYRQKYSGGGENVGWTKGTVNEYNILMMEELCTVFAAGAGGVSKILRPGGLYRLHDPKYPDEYIARIKEIAAEKSAVPDALKEDPDVSEE